MSASDSLSLSSTSSPSPFSFASSTTLSSSPSFSPSPVSSIFTPPPFDPTTYSTPSLSSSPPSSSSVPLPSSSPAPSPSSSSTTSASTPSTTSTSLSAATTSLTTAQPTSASTPLLAGAGIATPASPSSVPVSTSSTLSPSPTDAHSSDLGFFSNSGAVAGTFTVVGLVGVAAIIAASLFIVKHRRRSRSYEDDTEFLDKTTNLSLDPPMTLPTSHDDVSSDQSHYGYAPMALTPPAVAFYPDDAYAFHPQAFSAAGFPPPGSHGYPGFTQDYPVQHIRPPDDYIFTSAPRVDASVPHTRNFADLQPVSAPPPLGLRPSVNATLSVPSRQEDRLSVDSFYTGIATDPPAPGRAF